jgi:DegV family protein with EDD domain
MTQYLDAFASAAEIGTPMLFLSFSSGLSGTFDAALLARENVLQTYPEAQIRVVDTLSAAALQALLVIEAARRRDNGATFEELVEWVEANKLHANGYFTIDSLESLRRGGRVSDMAAVAGTMLDVKPILRVNGQGELVIDRPVRGRKKSLRAIADAFEKRAHDTAQGTVVVAHGDAAADAVLLEGLLRERADIGTVTTIDVGPVIGSHTGPGMIAAAFWGTKRDS